MVRYGLMRRIFNGVFEITERGKIALAIEVGCRTKSRARGLRAETQSFKSFEDAA